MNNSEKKELGFERFIFFSDAIVAIAITLLALDLKLEVPALHHITFTDMLLPWKKYLAFLLSFINIAGFWRTHHRSFTYIHKIDEKMIAMNLAWLFFIVTLPFTTSLISSHFTDAAPLLLYCINIFLLSVLQNFLWDYAVLEKNNYIEKATLDEETLQRIQLMFNLDMLNGLVAVVVCFFQPVLAFVLLFFKIPLFVFATFYIAKQRRKEKFGSRPKPRGKK